MLVISIAVAGLCAACANSATSPDDVAEARAVWNSQRPDGYSIRLEGHIGDTPESFGVAARGDDAVGDGGQPQHTQYGIGGLFDLIDDALAANVDVSADFDGDLGYPTRIRIDAYDNRPSIDLKTDHFAPIDLPEGCDSEPGSVTDVTAEPIWWLYQGDRLRWSDTNGCAIRVDIIEHYLGPCGWEAAEFITTGNPIGTPLSDGQQPLDRTDTRTYIWDPDGVLAYIDDTHRNDIIPIDDLPDTAIDTGYRRAGAELWADPADDRHIWRVTDDHAQQLLHDKDDFIVCA